MITSININVCFFLFTCRITTLFKFWVHINITLVLVFLFLFGRNHTSFFPTFIIMIFFRFFICRGMCGLIRFLFLFGNIITIYIRHSTWSILFSFLFLFGTKHGKILTINISVAIVIQFMLATF